MTSRRIWVVVGSLTLATAACGGSGDSKAPTTSAPAPVTTEASPETTQAPAPTTQPTKETTPPESAAPTTEGRGSGSSSITSYRDVQPATIQIEAVGSFRDPEDFGNYVGAGRGSGFIISADGYAITNNHVVTGAGTLEIAIGGDTSDTYNAQVIGASECNDLALIKINEDDLPFLDIAPNLPTVGEEIFVAGFPLGDPEFTLVRGIVSKADADGESSWSSIDHVIQHDAEAQPGNSGGPLVNEAGQVVGVHYMSYNPGTGTTQKFAISSETLEDVLPKLYEGDFESLGINGQVVWDDVLGISGVWVSAVKAGSPASSVGLKAGDIITELNGVPLGTEGTMQEYCDVIRTAGSTTPMAIQVVSWDEQSIYEGEINNPDKKLVLVGTFGGGTAPVDTGATPDGYEYNTVFSDNGELQVDIPTSWSYDDRQDGQKASIWASADFDTFPDSWGAPGFKMTVFPTEDTHTVQEMYDLLTAPDWLYSDCTTPATAEPYDDGVFIGLIGIFTGCGVDNAESYTVVSAVHESARLVTIEFEAITDADHEALEQAIATFNLN